MTPALCRKDSKQIKKPSSIPISESAHITGNWNTTGTWGKSGRPKVWKGTTWEECDWPERLSQKIDRFVTSNWDKNEAVQRIAGNSSVKTLQRSHNISKLLKEEGTRGQHSIGSPGESKMSQAFHPPLKIKLKTWYSFLLQGKPACSLLFESKDVARFYFVRKWRRLSLCLHNLPGLQSAWWAALRLAREA